MNQPTDYDGIFLGAGHNALVAAAYLARCGMRVAVLERAATPGGGLATLENPRLRGFWHNTHSFFHRAVTAMPWYRDLDLRHHGAEYIEPAFNVAMILRDGRVLQWWTDFDKTVASFAEFSPRDAARLAAWVAEFRPIVEQILIPEAQSPPLPRDRRRALLERSSLGRRLLEVSALSPLEFVTREFENDVVRAGLLFLNGLREVDLRLRGFGHAIPAMLAGPRMAAMCVGGSARLADALVRDITEHGGHVLSGVRIERIVLEDGRAVGVEVADSDGSGRGAIAQIRAGFVASGMNPQQTFLRLIDADLLSPTLKRQAEAFRYNLLAPLFGLNVALAEPPQYTAARDCPSLDSAFMVILGLERFEQFQEIVAAHEEGRIPSTVMWGCCPTVFDASQAPPLRHVAFMWEKLPYALDGDATNWDTAAEAHGREMLAMWRRYAPNLADGVVLDAFCRTPLDTERSLPNMQAGDLLVGSFEGQVGDHRPFAGAGNYRTAVPGLYLCGGATHPGGNITGLCGYNAARVIASDHGVGIWWDPPDVEAAWEAAT